MRFWGKATADAETDTSAPSSTSTGATTTRTSNRENNAEGTAHFVPGRPNPFRVNPEAQRVGAGTAEMGGMAASDGSLYSLATSFANFFRDEYRRPSHGTIQIQSSGDRHRRPPEWMEYKNVAIDGTLLTDEEKARNANSWEKRYQRELDVAEAIQEVRKQRRMETNHDVIGAVAQVRRFFGWSKPLDETYAKETVDVRYQLQEEADRLGSQGKASASPEAVDEQPSRGVMKSVVDPQTGTLRRVAVGEEATVAGTAAATGITAAWRALMTTVETGRPLASVAAEYKPRVDFYGLDPFLDSAPSVIWFSTKVGLFIGLVQGTARAVQAINVDVQFLKTSGVGVLSILNMSVFASVVKWGGNTAIFAAAFCFGDRLATMVKQCTLPEHDARQRSVANYVAGLSMAGATVGVLPWWVLSDIPLALRLGASGAVVGGVLGLGVGVALGRLVSLNIGRLDATSRQLRRYEAVMLRQRQWAQDQLVKRRSEAFVWW